MDPVGRGDSAEASARRIAIRNILVATDFSPAATRALIYAQSLASTYRATLHVVHVVKDLGAAAPIDAPALEYDRLQADLERKAEDQLHVAIAGTGTSAVDLKALVLKGLSPAAAILAYAHATSIDLILLGTHGRGGIGEFFLGSTAQKLVRSARCPVLTVRSTAGDPGQADTWRG